MGRIAVVALAVLSTVAVMACSLTGPPDGSYQRTCVDVPEDVCAREADDAMDRLPPLHPPVGGVEVRCTATSCTPESGQGETVVRFADGSSMTLGGWGYATPVGTPPDEPLPTRDPSVPVTCSGMPAPVCDERAGEVWTFDEVRAEGSPIVAITIRCTALVCDAERGGGTTVIRLENGQTQEIGWSYETGE